MRFRGGVGAGSRRFGLLCAVLALGGGARALLSFGQEPAQVTALELAARVDRHYDQLHSLKAGFREDYAGLGTDVGSVKK